MIQIFLVYIKYIYFTLDLPLLNVEVSGAGAAGGYTLTIYRGGQGETASPPDPAQGGEGWAATPFPLENPVHDVSFSGKVKVK